MKTLSQSRMLEVRTHRAETAPSQKATGVREQSGAGTVPFLLLLLFVTSLHFLHSLDILHYVRVSSDYEHAQKAFEETKAGLFRSFDEAPAAGDLGRILSQINGTSRRGRARSQLSAVVGSRPISDLFIHLDSLGSPAAAVSTASCASALGGVTETHSVDRRERFYVESTSTCVIEHLALETESLTYYGNVVTTLLSLPSRSATVLVAGSLRATKIKAQADFIIVAAGDLTIDSLASSRPGIRGILISRFGVVTTGSVEGSITLHSVSGEAGGSGNDSILIYDRIPSSVRFLFGLRAPD